MRGVAVVMSPDAEGLGAVVEAGLGSNLTQPCDISYFSLYMFSSPVRSKGRAFALPPASALSAAA